MHQLPQINARHHIIILETGKQDNNSSTNYTSPARQRKKGKKQSKQTKANTKKEKKEVSRIPLPLLFTYPQSQSAPRAEPSTVQNTAPLSPAWLLG